MTWGRAATYDQKQDKKEFVGNLRRFCLSRVHEGTYEAVSVSEDTNTRPIVGPWAFEMARPPRNSRQ